MLTLWIVIGAVVLAWLLLNLPRGRSDGELQKKIHPYRKMLPFIMQGRNESVCYYDDYVRTDALLDYIAKARKKFHVDVTHCLVGAAVAGLRDNPTMNQFISGKRLYRRNRIAVTFSMKRKKLNKEAKLAAVKLFFEPDETFEQICRRINEKIGVERSDAETYTDKELGVMTRLPRPILGFCIRFINWLDYHNLVPRSFIDNDGFYTSMFIANLGSLGMQPAYHHLYEYGNCPLFMMVGRIEKRPLVEGDQVVARETIHIRWSYDERIDDGLTAKHGIQSVHDALENPEQTFGAIEAEEGVEDVPDAEVAGSG